MRIKPIKTETDYHTALKEIERIFDAAPNTREGDRLEVLTTLVEAYEEKHFHIPSPDPIEAILYYIESRGLTRRDLERYIGSRARVSEVLNRRRPLTMEMIRNLHKGFGIPVPSRTLHNACRLSTSAAIVAAITTTVKKYPVTVLIPAGKGGLKENSMVNLAQLLIIDKGRLTKKLGYLGEEKMTEVDEAIRISLGITK
jgi:HTH-type transcriptional regulator/antitoxin HigA